MGELSYRRHWSEGEPSERPKPLRPEPVIIKAPVDLLEWIEDKRPDVEDVRTTLPILRAMLRQPHPRWGADWRPWLEEKYYR